ncbi:MAG: ATP-binding protein [Oscillospiraceae bacterium]
MHSKTRSFDSPHAGHAESEGSGLGLYICNLTAEELGGTISAKSQPGEGTTFTLRLPCDSNR